MAKNVKRIILSEKQPNNKHIAWAKPSGDNIDLKIFEDNKWRPIAGGGSSNSTDTSNAINIDSIQGWNMLGYYCTEVRGFTEEYVDSMSDEEYDKLMAEYTNWLDSATFISEKHGTATYHENTGGSFNTWIFICEDGYGINQVRGEISPKRRYKIVDVTELPTRENAPAEEPAKNLTQGVSLKIDSGGGTSSSTLFVVLDTFTDEYVDPLVLHKLTDTICYYEGDDIYSLLTWDAINMNADKLPAYQTSTNYNSVIISWWSCYSNNKRVKITYDYQVTFLN